MYPMLLVHPTKKEFIGNGHTTTGQLSGNKVA